MEGNSLTPKRDRELKYRHGITLVQYNALLKSQGGVCAICKKKETSKVARWNKVAALSVDHCHTKKHIRGLLCQRCNRALGFMRDDPALLIEAAYYLLERQG